MPFFHIRGKRRRLPSKICRDVDIAFSEGGVTRKSRNGMSLLTPKGTFIFGLTHAALYSPTTGDNAPRKGRYLPPKTTGVITQL
jgi:hypothetical protein